MMSKTPTSGGLVQGHLFKIVLKDLVSPRHPLVRLAETIDWESFESDLHSRFCQTNGRPCNSVRLMIGLHYLKYAYDLSDEAVLAEWCENPYWQHFCGGIYFEHEPPIDSSSMTRWRKYLAESGAEKLLEESIRSGLKLKLIRKRELEHVSVDTTVQEKHVRHPTDSRLYDRLRETLVREAVAAGITLRQSYAREGKKSLRRIGGYGKARQFRRLRRETRRLRTFLGRVARDIRRKAKWETMPESLRGGLAMAARLLEQKRHDKKKLYSIHEPQVECISKGKAHKPYEFGCKASLVASQKGSWILGAKAFHGNPYDGHTLSQALEQSQRIAGCQHAQVVCDLGYRGHNYEGQCDVQIVNRFRKKVPAEVARHWRRRSAIEPVIGHAKSEHRMERNRLKGIAGDCLNAIMAAVGFNFRKLMRGIAALFRRGLMAWLMQNVVRQKWNDKTDGGYHATQQSFCAVA